MPPSLSTSALTLRFPSSEDAPAVAAAVQESLAGLLPWAPWCQPSYGLADAEAWIAGQPAAREAGSAFEFVITRGDRLLGACGINAVNPLYRMANLGYWVRTSETRRGVATAAVGLLADWTFANTDLERLEVVVAVGNEASLRVAARAGAVREGVLRSRLLVRGRFHDAVMHSIVRSARRPGAGTT